MVDLDNLKVQNTNIDYSNIKSVIIFNHQEINEMNEYLGTGAFVLLGIASGISSEDGSPMHTFAVGCIDGEIQN
ncbi:hypothetical protein [Gilliamella sp. wkB308]|uniref:hypothetical protein n=1 Tax=Gilliamella sp. wkB308 TaxID=3120263 RepID=UPI00080E524A|nr:hypothetical protein [Gilliamella apicola]OCF98826.1 hypothetical protein A9G10_06265 [Gilliamella apicola]